MEFKTKDSKVDPIEQWRKSVLMQYGAFHKSKGVLIGVKGVQWRYVEYHFVMLPLQKKPELLLRDFHDFTKGPERVSGRPIPSKEYAAGDYMDFEIEEEGKDILRAMIWVAKGKHDRDLKFLSDQATSLPQSFTQSTVNNGVIVESYDEDAYKLGSDFDYLLPFLDEQSRGGSGNTDSEQEEAGGQSQESERMEIE
jgi:hypothetical protein